MRTALIQGSGGLGSALAQVVIEARVFDQVILAGRGQWSMDASDTQIRTVPVDLTSDQSVAEAAERVRSWCERLHLVITTAGVLTDPSRGIAPEKKLTELTREAFQSVMEVNCLGPFLWLKALYPLIKHREPVTIATLSARVGSIGDNRLGGWHSYRASKAAQNMLTRNLALELGRLNPNAVVVGLHPGTVDTGLSKPYQKGVSPEHLFTPAQSAAYLWSVIQALTPADSGQVFDWKRVRIEP